MLIRISIDELEFLELFLLNIDEFPAESTNTSEHLWRDSHIVLIKDVLVFELVD